MKKIFENLYIFSKLTLSFLLLISLVGVLYVFYSQYKNEEINSKNQIFLKDELKININKNSELIKNLSKEIKTTDAAIKSIQESINSLSKQNNSKEFIDINKNIDQLNDNLVNLSKEFEKIKSENLSRSYLNKNENYEINQAIENIIDTILIKYENNINFNSEINYLKKVLPDHKSTKLEKLTILSMNPYKGHNSLKNIFDNEVNNYLKEYLDINKESFFNKIFLPYINISPTSENKVTNDLVISIKMIDYYIENKNFENALRSFKEINNHERSFTMTLLEIKKFLNFKEELIGLKL